MNRILLIGDAAVPTGYARVIKSIFGPLAHHYDIEHIATRYSGGAHSYDWPLISTDSSVDPYGFALIEPTINRFKPDVVFLLYDLFYQAKYIKEIQAASPSTKIALYSPVESGPFPDRFLQIALRVDRYVVFTDFARDLVLTADARNSAGEAAQQLAVDVIPHGIDTDNFYALAGSYSERKSTRVQARKKLGFDDDLAEHGYIVFNGNRNMPKKRLDLTIESFAKFAEGKPEHVKLYLHTAVKYFGWNIDDLAQRFNVSDRLILTSYENTQPDVSNEKLNLIYNACDVGINTSTNEGWGLVSFEHAATRAPQIVPDHSCLSELWRGRAELVRPFHVLINEDDLCDKYLLHPNDVADALQRVYQDEQLANELSLEGFENATRSEYLWANISKEWHGLIEGLIAETTG